MTEIPCGARFNTWLARAAIATRDRAGLRREDIAAIAGVGVGVDQVSRFEKGLQTPRHLDRVIAAYAEGSGLTSIEIYQRAIDLWRQHGSEPITGQAEAMPERPKFHDEREDDARDSRVG